MTERIRFNPAEAYHMLVAGEKIRSALAEARYAPR